MGKSAMFVIAFLSLAFQNVSAQEYDCGWYGTKTVEERNKIFPFSETKKVLLVSYSNYEMLHPLNPKTKGYLDVSLQEAQQSYPKIISKIVLASEDLLKRTYFTLEEKELDKGRIEELSHIMCNYIFNRDPKGEEILMLNTTCYTPRNSILFLDENDTIICCIEICFECYSSGMRPDPAGLNSYANTEFCLNRYNIIKDFFRRNKITIGVEER
jgi:hypothetical protein